MFEFHWIFIRFQEVKCQKPILLSDCSDNGPANVLPEKIPFLSQLMLNETMLQDWGRNSCFSLRIFRQFIFRVRNCSWTLKRRMLILFDCFCWNLPPMSFRHLFLALLSCKANHKITLHWFGVTKSNWVKPSLLDKSQPCVYAFFCYKQCHAHQSSTVYFFYVRTNTAPHQCTIN